jgi:hypothetical protein
MRILFVCLFVYSMNYEVLIKKFFLNCGLYFFQARLRWLNVRNESLNDQHTNEHTTTRQFYLVRQHAGGWRVADVPIRSSLFVKKQTMRQTSSRTDTRSNELSKDF